MSNRYTAYKLNLDGFLDHKEHLDNLDEVNEWIWRVNHNNMIVVGQEAFVYLTRVGDDINLHQMPLSELDSFINRYAS